MKLKDWLNKNRELFLERDLRFLIKNVFNGSPVFISEEYYLDTGKLRTLEKIKKWYIEGLPMAYILGKEDFFGFEFKVNPDVLIPRKETELIVEKALEVIEKDALRCVLDLCCGCGNISISLKKIFDDKINVFASDISLEALRVARRNAELHKADIKIINADLFSGLRWKFFDLIVSNPPYVENKYIKDSLKYEPRIALQANNNGLYYIEKILKEGHDYLKKDGYLIMEIGYNHKDYVSGLLKKLGIYEIIEWIKDYDGNWRGIVLKVPNYK